MQENLREGKKSYLADSLQVCLTCTAQLTGIVALLMNIEQLNRNKLIPSIVMQLFRLHQKLLNHPFEKNVKKSVRIAEGRVSK